ncbi:MAG TPA: hypothetical protein VFY05_02580, partial [Candidatus Angelobacter sp.]|nr:hypothetical protein [Candidatus Angelobacter sp.]
MKMLRRTNGFEPRLLNLLLFALLLCAFAFSGGCVISPRRIVGGGTGATPTPTPGVSPTPTPVPGAQGKLYVTNLSGNSILRFDNALAANGDATPAAVITGGQTTISSPENIFLDVAADRLYVANQGGSSVLIYDGISTKTGDAPPTRTIFGPNSLLGLPIDVAVDKTRDLLYVAD